MNAHRDQSVEEGPFCAAEDEAPFCIQDSLRGRVEKEETTSSSAVFLHAHANKSIIHCICTRKKRCKLSVNSERGPWERGTGLARKDLEGWWENYNKICKPGTDAAALPGRQILIR